MPTQSASERASRRSEEPWRFPYLMAENDGSAEAVCGRVHFEFISRLLLGVVVA